MSPQKLRKRIEDKMADIKPGRDRCETTKVCLPTRPAMDDLLSRSQQGYEPGEQLYPFCYEVMQCRGSCCDEEVTCEPIESELIKKPKPPLQVMRVVYDPSTSRFVIDDIYELEFRQDLSCSCGNCSRNIVEATECPEGKKVASSCACECENLREKIACKEKEGMWRWNEEECQCVCEVRECRLGALLNYETCECEDDGE
uniref:PDGF_2 domain-containing protein n=1 Tax=Ascaris lumbricoides TaxID=6252 RepID=A0A0M3I5D0_ASCLU